MIIRNVYVETVKAHGHPNIRGTHRSTIEITREEELTPRGDCIIGVGADKAINDLSPEFLETLKNDDAVLIAILSTSSYRDTILAQGSRNLILDSNEKIIIRKSSYIEPSTLGIKSNKAARDINRGLINELRNPNKLLEVKLLVFRLSEIEPVNIGVGRIVQHPSTTHRNPSSNSTITSNRTAILPENV